MPYQIKFDNLPAGYAMSAAKPGEEVKIIRMEFCSSEDGDHFIRRLEGFPNDILSRLPAEPRPQPSTIDHMLAVIHRDMTATVYINELEFIGKMQSKRDVKQGEPIFSNDIADIQAIRFVDVDIPVDAGVVFLFSVGWRKGLFFDVAPIQRQGSVTRPYDLSIMLGQYYAYLLFQEFFKIPESAWNRLFSKGWFPFISLRTETVQLLVNYAKTDWNIDEVLDSVVSDVREELPKWHEKWEKGEYFADHIDVLGVAVERFLSDDFISAVAILYPRIEGVMRSYHTAVSPDTRQTQTGLVQSILSGVDPIKRPKALLLPEKFKIYLTDIYFANFDPKNPKGVSRNTVAHGVAQKDEYSEKAAVIGFLILDQLSFYTAADTNTATSFHNGKS
jgi:hypothetical protein